MTKSSKTQVLVVGAGPTGMLAAIWLKTLNPDQQFRIISKGSKVGDTSRALTFHARTMEFYRQLDLHEEACRKAVRLQRMAIREYGVEKGGFYWGPAGAGLSYFPHVFMLPQDEHEEILEAHLTKLGVKIEWSTELIGYEQHDDSCTAMIRAADGEEELVEAEYILGCDGAHSAVRKLLPGLEFEGGTYSQRFFVSDVTVPGFQRTDDVNLCFANDEFCLYLALGGDRVRVVGHVPGYQSDDDPSKLREVTFEDVRPVVKMCTGADIEKCNWFTTYSVHHKVAQEFRRDRVFLLGDAAHLHSPVGGQGMNTGLGDASNLCWKLSDVLAGRAAPALLDTYEPERKAFAQLLVNTTDSVFKLTVDMGWRGWFYRRVLMPHILPALWRWTNFPRIAYKRVSQLEVNYRGMALAATGASASGSIVPGDRLPWFKVADGKREDNHAALAERRWQVHAFMPVAGHAGFPVKEFDIEDARKAGFDPALAYFVRPDGYVGLVFKADDGEAVGKYAEEWGLKPRDLQ